ncbi:uncharacterized protein LOC132604141 [Lycium barbarum]|uniref:uncharacterized protein LOC132604141 n=1 Tax=Lycium barbarum TaxID=112863 RepID=UPI00293F778E|nr:uncharacterized protein LOC132604141 [Lycium barbarum]
MSKSGICQCTLYFTIGAKVKGADNLWDCEVKFKDSTESKKASALVFSTFEEAQKQYDMFCAINSKWVPKTYGVKKDPKTGQGLVLVERIFPFDTWLYNTDKNNMWNIIDGVCIGVGTEFKKKFNQIILGVEAIHKYGSRHGNLSKGVYLGVDQNVRLGNFFHPHANSESLKKDLLEFKELVTIATSKHPPPRVSSEDVPKEVPEVQQFYNLFDHFTSKGNFREGYASWLYRAPLLWGSCKKAAFFNWLNRAFEINPNLVKEHFNQYISHYFPEGWEYRISANTPLLQTWEHQVPSLSDPSIKEPNWWYMYSYGIVVLIRNFYHHCPPDVKPINHVEYDFPEVLGVVYYEFATGPYKNQVLVPGDNAVPAKKVIEYIFEEPWFYGVEFN